MSKPPLVSGLDDEDRLMGACTCRGTWRLVRNDVSAVAGRWHDRVAVLCQECGFRREFVFDVTTFFEPRPGIWA